MGESHQAARIVAVLAVGALANKHELCVPVEHIVRRRPCAQRRVERVVHGVAKQAEAGARETEVTRAVACVLCTLGIVGGAHALVAECERPYIRGVGLANVDHRPLHRDRIVPCCTTIVAGPAASAPRRCADGWRVVPERRSGAAARADDCVIRGARKVGEGQSRTAVLVKLEEGDRRDARSNGQRARHVDVVAKVEARVDHLLVTGRQCERRA
mmetsp:Transcript_10570/g.28114  ORF Transcript_10570/g.28114 Transcript_10570/m.28114 type:complete len:214 (-) Transcript_10570:571-1212(-)